MIVGKGDNYRPVDPEKFRRNYDRIFGEQRAPWDDEACDEQMKCLDCMDSPCMCDWQRIEDEYRE